MDGGAPAVALFDLFGPAGFRLLAARSRLPSIVLRAEIGSQVQAMFDKDMAASDTSTLEQLKRRPLNLRVSALFARFWKN